MTAAALGRDSGQCCYHAIHASVRRGAGEISGAFKGLHIGSAFQPIYSLAHRRAVGYEALLRATAGAGTGFPPQAVFALTAGEAEAVFLDRLCRTVHLGNFMAADDGKSWLFLNVSPQVVVRGPDYGSFFLELLARNGMPAARVVVEILEGQIDDDQRLASTVAYYKDLGCLVAIDDFGAGHSNFDRIWKVSPHIVKFDRSMITQAATSRTIRRALPSLVSLIHETGSLTLMEGIETGVEALIALDSGFDLVQGYYFGRPGKAAASPEPGSRAIADLHDCYDSQAATEANDYRQEIARYEERLRQAAALVAAGAGLAAAAAPLLASPRAERCYLLASDGRQIGGNVCAPASQAGSNPRFKPLADGRGAVWSRRHYFRRAVNHPGEVQTTRPYLSIAAGNMCITLSVTLHRENRLVVLCCDLDWG
ncbi:MAG: diguanylate phosphodiesterase [Rhodocyclaceae bacterium]|nr:diguanylate phosphodiesterase [Rhodocyclaceae bacterium]